MDKRHDDMLTSRLEQIYTDGAAYISWNELYLWYDVQAIAARTYRDLSSRWDALSQGWTLGDGTDLGKLMFVCSPSKINPGLFVFGANMAAEVISE
jgi:hypothetical protein